jgi:hypothetical protein
MRGLLAIGLKDLWHHGLAIVGQTGLMFCALIIAVSAARANEADTLMTAATGMAYYGLPMAIAALCRRLFVIEWEEGTWELLRSLPTRPTTLVGVRLVIALVIAVGWAWSCTLGVAVVAWTRELVGVVWLLALMAQTGAIAAAWTTLCFMAAQLGRYRFAFWIALMLLLSTFYQSETFFDYTWHAALVQSIDRTRYAFPWLGMVVTIGWTMMFALCGLVLAGARGGSWVANWFEPMSMRRAGGLAGGLVVMAFVMSLVENQLERRGPELQQLPRVPAGAIVRVPSAPGTPVWRTGVRLGCELDALSAWLGGVRWKDVVLVPSQADLDDDIEVLSTDAELVLRVEDRDDEAIVRDALWLVLAYHGGGFSADQDDEGWLLDGFPGWWLDRRQQRDWSGAMGLRAAAAAQREPGALDRWGGVRARLGRVLASGAGYAAVRAVEQEGGRDAVRAAATTVLAPAPSRNALGSLQAWWRSGMGATGLSREQLDGAWSTALADALAARSGDVAGLPGLDVVLTRHAAGGAVAVDWSVDSIGDLELHWLELPMMHTEPDAWPEVEREEATRATGRLWTFADSRSTIVARGAVHVAALEGQLVTPWVRLDP